MGMMDRPAGFAYVGPFNEKEKCFAYVAERCPVLPGCGARVL